MIHIEGYSKGVTTNVGNAFRLVSSLQGTSAQTYLKYFSGAEHVSFFHSVTLYR